MTDESANLKKTNYELNQELLQYFLGYSSENTDKSEKTILNLKRDLQSFLEFLAENKDAMIQYKNIIHYLDYIEEKYKESSYISKASSLRQFVNWLNLEENPFWKIKIAVNYEDFKFYTPEEIFPNSEEQFNYDRLLIRALYELYLSIDELSGLKLSDYNLAGEKISLRDTQIKVSDELALLLKKYIKEYRPSLCGNQSSVLTDPLFILESGQALTSLDIIQILKQRELKNIYLKRSRIIHMMEAGKLQSEIETELGIKLSNFYAPFVKEREYRLLSAYKEYHPRSSIN